MSGSYAGASPEPVRRFEVFTGEGRRRSWTTEEKLSLVAQMASCGNISALARQHGVRASQLFTWRREMRYAADATVPPAFVPAVVDHINLVEQPPTVRRARRRSREGSAVELEIDGVAVKIARGADARTITAVIEALRGRR